MEISTDELAKMFEFHREHMWRWSLDPDERKYPRSVEMTLEGFRPRAAVVRIRYIIGPAVIRDVRYPLYWLLELFDSVRLTAYGEASAIRLSVPCESTNPCAQAADFTCAVHNALAPWLLGKTPVSDFRKKEA